MNAARTRRGGHYHPGRKRKANTAALTGLAAIIAITFLLVLSARAIVSRAACGAHPVVVNVAVSAEIGPAIQHVGQVFNNMHRRVGGRCAAVVVRAEPPAAVMAWLAGGRAARHLPRVDAWIPDSGLWAGLAHPSAARGRQVQSSGIRVARTALVIVMPRSAAAQTPAFGSSVSWKFLLPQAAGGPAAALGLIEGVADGVARFVKLAAQFRADVNVDRNGTEVSGLEGWRFLRASYLAVRPVGEMW